MHFAYKGMRNVLVIAAAATVFSGLPAVTSVAQADPPCAVSASGSVANRSKLTVSVTKNPCRHQVRAWVECVSNMGTKSQKTSGAIGGTGTVRVDCGSAYVNRSGHEVNVPGQGWTRYVY
ncbi:hypothetical protein [Streptomyces lavendulocolor]|uniref:hypothetical protein n=1 Tax=Streptomyces lavendulocolor TaxID=67316 RepID=UPI003C2BC8D0